jgi:hypothetical protein
MIQRYSLHKIDDSDALSFSKEEYSRFKFGSGSIARKFGRLLGQRFINDVLSTNYSGEPIVVVSSPYSFIPTATFYMKNFFIYELNSWLIKQGFPVATETKIHRTTSYSEDYGMLSAEERMKLIGNDNFHIDRDYIQGKLVFFLDDVRITGSHEKVILTMLKRLNLTGKFYLLYFAELTNTDIPASFENELNYAYVKDIQHLKLLSREDEFSINTRIVKYLLNSSPRLFAEFLESQQDNFSEELLNLAIGNSYHKIEAYIENFLYLQQLSLLKTKKN